MNERTCPRCNQTLDAQVTVCGLEDAAGYVQWGLQDVAAAITKLAEAVQAVAAELARRGTP